MSYTVRVRGVEIVCESLEDVDQLVQRYGGDVPQQSTEPARAAGARGSVLAPDLALLRALVSVGLQGVSSENIGHMLGTKGKGIPPALQRWAVRVGIAQSEDGEVFEVARPQGLRGWRLKNGALAVARTVLERS